MYRCENCNARFDDSSELQKCLVCGGSLVKEIKQESDANSKLKPQKTPSTKSTKECPKCKTEIPKGASKCPNCQSDIRSWFRRHPVLTLLLVLFISPIVIVSLAGSGSKNTSPSVETGESEVISTPPEAIVKEEEFNKKVEQLRTDLKENLNKSVGGGSMFIGSYIQRVNDDLKLELTVSDDWYYLAKYQQDRLLEDVWQYFNLLGVKHGLREEDTLPWKVRFVDVYEKKVAEQGWW